ncbi:asparaginase [Capnocytophaga stomatis]|uniref:asparaginase n=1 Tax=Capnocytophaga stomatis TaxID=1848904 RepID=A0A250FUB9_9FLAO|nr:asparaginase [Capnocytophaga stomatis]ATA88759.1 L-asparaginase 1 [Capnocytophaga stomatis]GIJ95413.1 L-asparaginase 1 [Capnocytophaga stomatis]GIJ96705.1 L-asparaginase 1 [Capnocytophaga stomatis]GIM50692.1 L-asparaginase 1 [Capnocytophaga stomatis]
METESSKILLIYTGGTIGMIKDYETGVLKAFEFENIYHRIPELSHLDCLIDSVSFEKAIDSSDMNPEHWVNIAETIEKNYDNYDGFVVLHGSDTMSYSASALSFMLEGLSKPVIFTGSQLPIGDLRTDAKENLITSIQLAALKENGESVIKEVGLYFEYKLYRGNRTTKINAENFQAFVSINYPTLAESGVHLKVMKENLLPEKPNVKLKVWKEFDQNVAIIKLFPGITEKILNGIFNISGLKAVVLETYGSGNAPTEGWFLKSLEAAIEKGIHIVNVTQCSGGSVILGKYEASEYLRKIGVINGKDITTEAAIVKLMILLKKNISSNLFKIKFEENISGEI